MKYMWWIIGLVIVVGALAYFLVIGRSVAPTMESEQVVERLGEQTSNQQKLFRINPSQSKASFELPEVLYGNDNLVVGTTNDLAGDVFFDLDNPANSKMGQIVVNARTIKTDNERRNNAIANAILKSSRDKYQFIKFNPQELTDLPESIVVGEPFSFKITGDLEITGVTREVEFAAMVTVEEDSLNGSAQTTVNRDDYNLTIPDVPFVASVDENVTLKAEIKANLVN